MSSYKTQCPRCHTVYPMPISKLGDEKARANCGKCQHTFFMNAHIIKDDADGLIQDGNDADDLNLPRKIIRSKKPKPIVAKEGMIFDDMAVEKENVDDISMDGLDEFMAQSVDIRQPIVASGQNTGQHDNNDEAWLDELIKDDKGTSAIATVKTKRTNDDLSELLGEDLDTLIPEASPQEDPVALRKKINERITAHAPTQEQLMTRRSLADQLVWVVGSFAMIGLLVGQYIFFNADNLARAGKASFVGSICEKCLPSANASVIKSSYLARSGMAEFTTDVIGTLTNTSTTDQLYPNIKIQVMGAQGLIGDLALSPKEYLVEPHRVIGASGSGRFMLTLDVALEDIHSITIEPFY